MTKHIKPNSQVSIRKVVSHLETYEPRLGFGVLLLSLSNIQKDLRTWSTATSSKFTCSHHSREPPALHMTDLAYPCHQVLLCGLSSLALSLQGWEPMSSWLVTTPFWSPTLRRAAFPFVLEAFLYSCNIVLPLLREWGRWKNRSGSRGQGGLWGPIY